MAGQKRGANAKPGATAKRFHSAAKRASTPSNRAAPKRAGRRAGGTIVAKTRKGRYPSVPRSPYLKFGKAMFNPFHATLGDLPLPIPGAIGEYVSINTATSFVKTAHAATGTAMPDQVEYVILMFNPSALACLDTQYIDTSSYAQQNFLRTFPHLVSDPPLHCRPAKLGMKVLCTSGESSRTGEVMIVETKMPLKLGFTGTDAGIDAATDTFLKGLLAEPGVHKFSAEQLAHKAATVYCCPTSQNMKDWRGFQDLNSTNHNPTQSAALGLADPALSTVVVAFPRGSVDVTYRIDIKVQLHARYSASSILSTHARAPPNVPHHGFENAAQGSSLVPYG